MRTIYSKQFIIQNNYIQFDFSKRSATPPSEEICYKIPPEILIGTLCIEKKNVIPPTKSVPTED